MHKVLNQNWKKKRKSELQKCNKSIIKIWNKQTVYEP
jgi:hypothetical protein